MPRNLSLAHRSPQHMRGPFCVHSVAGGLRRAALRSRQPRTVPELPSHHEISDWRSWRPHYSRTDRLVACGTAAASGSVTFEKIEYLGIDFRPTGRSFHEDVYVTVRIASCRVESPWTKVSEGWLIVPTLAMQRTVQLRAGHVPMQPSHTSPSPRPSSSAGLSWLPAYASYTAARRAKASVLLSH